MKVQGWYERDTAGKFDGLRTSDNNVTNTGILTRHKLIGKGAQIELCLRPHLEIFHIDKLVPPGVPCKIRFTPVNPAFVLTRGDGNDNPKLEIVDAKFYCNTVKATNTQYLAIVQAIREIAPSRVYINRATLKSMSIATGSTSVNMDNIYLGPIPNGIILGFVT